MRISLLHTGEVHVGNFAAIFKEIDASIALDHRVEEGLLDRARAHGTDSIRADTLAIFRELGGDADAVLCTCSTLGQFTDEAAQSDPRIVRVDRPLMEAACADGANILVAICLESTRDATLALLEDCAGQMGKAISPEVVLCKAAWPHFEAGDMAGYANEINRDVRAAVANRAQTDCVVLAQASMRVAEDALADLGIPVRTSPVLAVERSIAMAKANHGN